MNKKAIAILGAIFLLIVGTLGFLIYSKYSVKDNTTTTNSSTTTPDSGIIGDPVENPDTIIPETPTDSVVKLTESEVVSPALFFDGSGITYFDIQGNLFQSVIQNDNGKVSLTGKKQLDIPQKQNITKVLWPAKGSDFIVEFKGSTGKRLFSYFNSVTQLYTDLPEQVYSLDWMPNGNQIMYTWLENNKSTLNLSDGDTKNWKYLADMWENDDALAISPDGTQLIYYETENTGTSNPINSVTSDGKIWKTLVKTGQNIGALWSPDGQKFLFAKKDLTSLKYQLWVYNLTSEEVKNLGFFSTPEKAVWDKDSNVVYVSVPSLNTSSNEVLTQDSFFRMDTTTLEKKEYTSSSMTLDGRNLFLNSTSDKLFFKNAQDGALYYLDLTK